MSLMVEYDVAGWKREIHRVEKNRYALARLNFRQSDNSLQRAASLNSPGRFWSQNNLCCVIMTVVLQTEPSLFPLCNA